MSDSLPHELVPIAIERESDSAIRIQWSDDSLSHWTARQLREACPCATCREKQRGESEPKAETSAMLPVLSAAEAQPLRIEAMKPVGSYAYNIAFSDGHSSGIYPFGSLYKQ